MLLDPSKTLNARLPAVAISESHREQLNQLSESTGLTVSELVRRSVALFLREVGSENSANVNSATNRREVER